MAAAAVLCAGMVSGCGGGSLGDYVDLQGGVFDALGVSTATQKAPKEPKVSARPGLVLPPSEDRLPEPGSEKQQVAAAESWPVDPEQGKAQAKAEVERRQKEFCDKAMRDARLQGRDSEPIMGPSGRCNAGLLGQMGGWFDPKKDDTAATK